MFSPPEDEFEMWENSLSNDRIKVHPALPSGWLIRTCAMSLLPYGLTELDSLARDETMQLGDERDEFI